MKHAFSAKVTECAGAAHPPPTKSTQSKNSGFSVSRGTNSNWKCGPTRMCTEDSEFFDLVDFRTAFSAETVTVMCLCICTQIHIYISRYIYTYTYICIHVYIRPYECEGNTCVCRCIHVYADVSNGASARGLLWVCFYSRSHVQHTAPHCTTLHHTAPHCTTLLLLQPISHVSRSHVLSKISRYFWKLFVKVVSLGIG